MSDKILKEYQQFQEFKRSFKFHQLPIEDVNGTLFCDGYPLYDAEGKLVGLSEKWLNIGFMINFPLSRILSNLFLYDFEFRGHHLKSLEAFFQGIKFKNPNIQKYVFTYSGLNAYTLKAASDCQWQREGNLYWQGTSIKRNSSDYQALIDEVYISAAQNPLYRQALKNVDKPLIHSIGKTDTNETVLTRFEFENTINALSAFLKQLDRI